MHTVLTNGTRRNELEGSAQLIGQSPGERHNFPIEPVQNTGTPTAGVTVFCASVLVPG